LSKVSGCGWKKSTQLSAPRAASFEDVRRAADCGEQLVDEARVLARLAEVLVEELGEARLARDLRTALPAKAGAKLCKP
jgi:hypothetical protein